jgi:hypothetical protein
MEVRRRHKKNNIVTEIREAENFISRSEKTIKRLKNTTMGVEFIQSQISKLKGAISDKEREVEKLNADLSSVRYGGLDDEINAEYKQNEKRQKRLCKERREEKEEADRETKEKKSVSKEYWNGIISTSRDDQQKQRDMRYAYKYFNRVCDSLPDYIQKNLSEMPNNKGYIWRGVHFHGVLPERQGPRVMFEKKRGDILIIHEYTEREYRRYEKMGKERKKLVHKELRRIKNSGTNLLDYLKQ